MADSRQLSGDGESIVVICFSIAGLDHVCLTWLAANVVSQASCTLSKLSFFLLIICIRSSTACMTSQSAFTSLLLDRHTLQIAAHHALSGIDTHTRTPSELRTVKTRARCFAIASSWVLYAVRKRMVAA